ncbi:MAG: response regulator [Anaerolineae bacterium]|nr:response regulator [Anaerolineae bacterium]
MSDAAHARILVVEDEAVVARHIRRALERYGYTVVAIVSFGQEAISLVQTERIDLVVMDIVLPGGMDGIQAAEQITMQHDVPVIYLTAHTEDNLAERAKFTTPFGYLFKPFNAQELHNAIQMAIYKHGLDRQLREYAHVQIHLSEAIARLLELGGEAIHQYIVQEIVAMEPGCVAAAVTSFDPLANRLSIHAVAGRDDAVSKMFLVLNRNPVGMSIKLSQEIKHMLSSGRLCKVEDGVSSLTQQVFPLDVCQRLENLLEIKGIYSIGFVQDGTLLGNAVWAMRAGAYPVNLDMMTTFLIQASMALQRQWANEALRKSEAQYRQVALENARLLVRARQDAQTQEMLLREVNHRVKNNLAAVIGLLYTEQRHAQESDQAAYRDVLRDLTGRVQGLSKVHSMLSDAQWGPLPLDDLARQIIRAALQVLPREKEVRVHVDSSTVRVSPRQANDLALIVNELTTNTAKYALQGRDVAHIDVHIQVGADGHDVLLEYRNDGPPYPETMLCFESSNVGFDLIQNLVQRSLGGKLSLRNDPCPVTAIRFVADE